MSRLIDADAFGNRMYHEVFEKDSEDQRWDSGCWMRYKLFERVLREQPTVPQWIPCSVKLPDPDVWVLVSCDEDVTIMAVTEYGEWYFEDGDFTHGKVDAWMPLPDPWRAES